MTSLRDHERRITALETKVQEVAACHSESIYEMKRDLVENRIAVRRILDRFDIPRVAQEEVDDALDQE